MSKLIVGLTGGIGSGKTAVSDLFAELGIDIIDADLIAREVVEPGQPALSKIQLKFGNDILLENGSLNRTALREKVFQDESAKRWLNSLLHPLIRETMRLRCEQAKSDYCILAVPLLIENGLTTMVNRVLVVDVNEELQLARASSRDGVDRKNIQAIMQSQASRQQRLAKADDIIDNNRDKSALIEQVNQLHHTYLELASR